MAAIRDWQDPLRHAIPTRTHLAKTVLVPLDGSDQSKVALPVARAVARLQSAVLHVVYVGERLAGPQQTLEQLGVTPQELRGAVLDREGGDPAEAIMRMAARLQDPLIVMSTIYGNLADEDAIGSVTQSVLSSSPANLLLVNPDRGEGPFALKRIVLAHDGTPSADAAIAPTAELAQQASAEVIALHVAAQKDAGPTEPGSLPAPRYIDQPQHEWPAWASEFVDRMLALGAPPTAMNFKLLVTGGQPGSEIAQFARDNSADMVVVPWHGNWERRIGAIDVVVRRSGCAVMLIVTTPAEDSTTHFPSPNQEDV